MALLTTRFAGVVAELCVFVCQVETLGCRACAGFSAAASERAGADRWTRDAELSVACETQAIPVGLKRCLWDCVADIRWWQV